MKKLKMGNLFEEDMYFGFMILELVVKGIEDWVKEVVVKGGKFLMGGNWKGVFIELIVIEDVLIEVNVWKEEIFGFVVFLYKYRCVKF